MYLVGECLQYSPKKTQISCSSEYSIKFRLHVTLPSFCPPKLCIKQEECIPVGYVPSAAVAVSAAPVDRILETRLWKHYLSATSFADGNLTLCQWWWTLGWGKWVAHPFCGSRCPSKWSMVPLTKLMVPVNKALLVKVLFFCRRTCTTQDAKRGWYDGDL